MDLIVQQELSSFAMITSMERTSSRLLKKERNKVAKQTFLYVIGTIVLILGFIFVILPAFIGIINTYLNKNPFPTQEVTLLQTPLVDAPPPATNQRELTLSGYSPTGTGVVLVLNGQQSSTAQTSDEGRFELKFNLINGSNDISVFATDESGAESPTSRVFTVDYDQDPPQLIIDTPANGAEFDKKTTSVEIQGVTDKGASVTINGRIVLVDSDGVFKGTSTIGDGDNEVTIVATDKAGNTTEQKLTIKRTN